MKGPLAGYRPLGETDGCHHPCSSEPGCCTSQAGSGDATCISDRVLFASLLLLLLLAHLFYVGRGKYPLHVLFTLWEFGLGIVRYREGGTDTYLYGVTA